MGSMTRTHRAIVKIERQRGNAFGLPLEFTHLKKLRDDSGGQAFYLPGCIKVVPGK